MRIRLSYLIVFLIAFTACEKEDEPVVLPEPGPVQRATVVMGTRYEDQVYFRLRSGKTWTAPYNNYDLAFETSPTGLSIYLNSGKFMFACNTGTSDFLNADSTGKIWINDADNALPDSLALSNWWTAAFADPLGLSDVYVIDRGRTEHSGTDRYRKFQVIKANDAYYEVRFSLVNNTNVTVLNIPKNRDYSLVYLSFSNNGKVVQEQAPVSREWDFVFTKYTHQYFDQPVTSPFRYYPVTGALINRWGGTEGIRMKKDSVPDYLSFDAFAWESTQGRQFLPNADIIGYEWKAYNFNSAMFTMVPDLYYVIRDRDGFYYKIRFIDFYDQSGNKGTVTFEYQRL